MADRARGTRGTPRGRAQAPRGRGTSSRGDRNNGPRGGGAGSTIQSAPEAKKKENILDLNKYIDKEICVRFNGGREGLFFLFFFSFRIACLGIFFPFFRSRFFHGCHDGT